jgi:hypothetical protein
MIERDDEILLSVAVQVGGEHSIGALTDARPGVPPPAGRRSPHSARNVGVALRQDRGRLRSRARNDATVRPRRLRRRERAPLRTAADEAGHVLDFEGSARRIRRWRRSQHRPRASGKRRVVAFRFACDTRPRQAVAVLANGHTTSPSPGATGIALSETLHDQSAYRALREPTSDVAAA